MSSAIESYSDLGFVAFSVDIRWDPSAKKGLGGKKSLHPRNWQKAGGYVNPDWNSVAINTGLSDLVVIDIDDDESYHTFKSDALAAGIPIQTREAKSGSGKGGHIYFRAIPGSPPLKSTDNIGIFSLPAGSSKVDLKAAGGLIYAPPSRYRMPDGVWREYRWVDEDVPIATLPPELQDILPKQDAPPAQKKEAKPAPRPATPNKEQPVSAAEVMSLLSKLKTDRASGGRNSDWLRVGFALKQNSELLKIAGRHAEADQMVNLFDVFSMRCPDKYPGRDAIVRDFASFKPGFSMANPVTMATLVSMAREDSGITASRRTDPVVNRVANLLGCEPDTVSVEKTEAGLKVTSPKGVGFVDLTDLTAFLPPSIVAPLASSDSERFIDLPLDFSATAKKHVKDFRRDMQLEYHRDSRDLARIKARGMDYPIVKIMEPHRNDSVVRYTADESSRAITVSDTETWNRELANALAKACQTRMGDEYSMFVNYGTIVVNNTTNESSDTSANKKIMRLEDMLNLDAKKRKLMKLDRHVYHPLEGKPCAYVIGVDYKKHISQLFQNDDLLRENPDNISKLERYLENFTDLPDFPELQPDRYLISFENGVLNIKTLEFTEYASVTETHPLAKKVARVHIDFPFTGSESTPVFDRILDYQFGPEVKMFFLALMGRLMFAVHDCDGWELAIYLYGVAGAGKTMIMNVIQNMFRDTAIATLASEKDGHFALEGLANAELVVGSDMPPDISKALDGTELQKMCSGEPITINQKGKKALQIRKWTAPLVFASNYKPSWPNSQDSIGRRLVPFHFGNIVKERDPQLREKIKREIPNICLRILKAYHQLRADMGTKDLTQHFPEKVREWSGDVRAASNDIVNFLSSLEEIEELEIEEGSVVWLEDFVSIYKRHTGDERRESELKKLMKQDKTAFAMFGLEVSETRRHTCKHCKRLHYSGCCSSYTREGSIKKDVVHNLCCGQVQS